MKIAVWGAGEIGMGVAYRLATTVFTSELHWINRTYRKIEYRVVDLEHGLDFAPTCRSVTAHSEEKAARALEGAGILVLTLGAAVESGQSRADLYPQNRDLFSRAVIPALRQGFEGVVLVVTNPVDLMARWVQRKSGLPHERVLGLGTVVETARLRASLGSYLSPLRPAREVWAYAVGSHDERFVPIAVPGCGTGSIPEGEMEDILDNARQEVMIGARRVKSDQRSTLHPIVEAVVKVAEAIALDREATLTVSVLDPDSLEGLYYSVPCTVGKSGAIHRHLGVLAHPNVQIQMEACREGLCETLRTAGEA
ncbi:MAG: hypothetical protein WAM82_13205 [Thermoanaerobaculia bacterium]